MIIKAFKKLNIYHKCSVLSGLLILLLFLSFIPFFFFDQMGVPLGLLLGGAYGCLAYLITGILENRRDDYYRWALVLSIARYIVLAILLFFIGLCYYKLEIKIFNIFSVVGGYFVCLVVLIVLFIVKDKKEKE